MNGGNTNGAGALKRLLRAFRSRNYRLFFTGQLISLVGTWMNTIAESWLVYRLTGSSLLLGTVTFAAQTPVFLLSTFGGLIADRFDRRKILIATQSSAMIAAATLATLTFAGKVTVTQVLVIAAIQGVILSVDVPSRQAFVVDIVERSDLVNAIALNSSMFNGARVVGPAVAGLVVGKVGEAWCFGVNAISYAAVVIALLMMRAEARRTRQALSRIAIADGFRFAYNTLPVRGLLLTVALTSVFGMPFTVLMPVFADRVLGSGPGALGILMGSSGVGALAAALTLAMRTEVIGLGRWVAAASASFGISLILFSLSRSLVLSSTLLVAVGYSMMLQMACSNTLIQAMVPDELRGRVSAIYAMMFLGTAPIGAMLAGSVAEAIGAPFTVRAGGVCCLMIAAWFTLRLPLRRAEGQRLIIAQGLAGGEPPQHMTIGVTEPQAADASGDEPRDR